MRGLTMIVLLTVLTVPTKVFATTENAPATAPGETHTIDHPTITFVDGDGVNVFASNRPLSILRTCDGCHDARFITQHSYHAAAGLDELRPPGSVPQWRPWDTSPGPFGRWSPFEYRYLTPTGETPLDLGTADWIRLFGARHTGGGPAVSGRNGTPLNEHGHEPTAGDAAVLDKSTGEAEKWNWDASGIVEFNCFICHVAAPANDERTRALRTGRFAWAATATLANTDFVSATDDGWRWNKAAFEKDGTVSPKHLAIVPPSSKHCGECHGLVHNGDEPVILSHAPLRERCTETTGQIFSAQALFDSGMNLASKSALGRPWDIHAERMLKCAHCHFAINDPAYATEESVSRPDHLAYDSRRLDIGEFLRRPNHNFAKGYSAQGTIANTLDGTMRRCEDCHNALATHDWLPYKERHMQRLLCESCHVPLARAPARRVIDWTMVTENTEPRIEYRGIQGPVEDPASLIDGYKPVLIPRVDRDGEPPRLSPNNFITTWFWVYGDPPRPVRLFDLKRALFDGDGYRADIAAACDADENGTIDPAERILDTPEKTAAVRNRLAGLGLADPRIAAEIQPYGLHHGIVTKQWARRECTSCHSESSDIQTPFVLAAAAPGGVFPTPVRDSTARMTGRIVAEDGNLLYVPVTTAEGFYVLGHDRWNAIDITGIVLILGTLAGALGHGGFRWYCARRRRQRS